MIQEETPAKRLQDVRNPANLRLIILNQFFYPDHSATSQLMTDLAESLVERGVCVTAIAGRGQYNGGEVFSAREKYRGVNIRRAWSTGFGKRHIVGRLFDYLTFYPSALWTLARIERHDIVMALTTPPLIGLVSLLAGRLRGMQVITLVQDIYPDIPVALGRVGKNNPMVFVIDQLSRLSFRYSDRVIVLGEQMRERILSKIGLNQAARIDVIHNWADGNQIIASPGTENHFRQTHNLQGKFVVMFSGNLGHVNEFLTVLEAARLLREQAEIVFLFVGKGAKAGEITNFVREQKLANVRLLPYQAREVLNDVLAAADVHLVTLTDGLAGLSVPSKTYPIMAAGRPMLFIGDKVSETARLIEQYDIGETYATGESAELANTIAQWATQPGKLKDYGTRARQTFEQHFDRPHAVDAYLAVFAKGTSLGLTPRTKETNASGVLHHFRK